jgi:hypothetical protein
MQKVHGAPVETAGESQRGYLAQPVMGPLVVSVSLLLILCAFFLFRWLGAA